MLVVMTNNFYEQQFYVKFLWNKVMVQLHFFLNMPS